MDETVSVVRISRDELLKLVENIDDETKDYCINDCIKCWDEKKLWDVPETEENCSLPVAMLNNEEELVSIIFHSNIYGYNTKMLTKIAYIQRLFTPKKFRNKGNFSKLLTILYSCLFEFGYNYTQLFIDDKVTVYKKLNFVTLFDTKDKKYRFVLQPIIHGNMLDNNRIIAKENVYNFYPEYIREYISKQEEKYA